MQFLLVNGLDRVPQSRGLVPAVLPLLLGALITLTGSTAAAMDMPDLSKLETQVWTAPEQDLHGVENQVARAIQIDPYSAHAHQLLSQVYVRLFSHNPTELRLLSTASDLAQQAIDLAPKKDYGYVALAMVLDTMGNGDRGLALLQDAQAAGVEPTWRAYFTLARLSSSGKRPSELLGLLKTALAFTDADRNIIVPYVVAMLQTEKKGDSLVHELQTWNETFPSHLFDLTTAMTLADSGQYQKAHKAYQNLLAKDQTQWEARVNDAILQYRYLGHPSDAIQQLSMVAAENPSMAPDTRAWVYLHLGAAQLKLGKFEQANAAFLSAITTDTENAGIIDTMISLYRQEKNHQALVTLIKELNVKAPGKSVLHALLGETLSEGLSDHRNALRAFTNAIALDPARSDYYNGMGLTYYRMRQYDAALRLFTAATDLNPNDATARYNEACVLALLERNEEALISLGDALSLDPNLQAHAKDDNDLSNLRHMKQFQLMVDQPAAVTTFGAAH